MKKKKKIHFLSAALKFGGASYSEPVERSSEGNLSGRARWERWDSRRPRTRWSPSEDARRAWVIMVVVVPAVPTGIHSAESNPPVWHFVLERTKKEQKGGDSSLFIRSFFNDQKTVNSFRTGDEFWQKKKNKKKNTAVNIKS